MVEPGEPALGCAAHPRELLKPGFEVAESTVSKYMIHHRGPPSQTWRTFLHNHADAIAAIDLCLVHTVTFERLFAVVIMGHGRRQLIWFSVTDRCDTLVAVSVEPSFSLLAANPEGVLECGAGS